MMLLRFVCLQCGCLVSVQVCEIPRLNSTCHLRKTVFSCQPMQLGFSQAFRWHETLRCGQLSWVCSVLMLIPWALIADWIHSLNLSWGHAKFTSLSIFLQVLNKYVFTLPVGSQLVFDQLPQPWCCAASNENTVTWLRHWRYLSQTACCWKAASLFPEIHSLLYDQSGIQWNAFFRCGFLGSDNLNHGLSTARMQIKLFCALKRYMHITY